MGGYSYFVMEFNMKKIIKTVLALCVFITASTSAFAYCSTGFACSIEALNEEQILQEMKFMQDINKYFSKEIHNNLFSGHLSPDINYNDLFIFSTIV